MVYLTFSHARKSILLLDLLNLYIVGAHQKRSGGEFFKIFTLNIWLSLLISLIELQDIHWKHPLKKRRCKFKMDKITVSNSWSRTTYTLLKISFKCILKTSLQFIWQTQSRIVNRSKLVPCIVFQLYALAISWKNCIKQADVKVVV